MGQPPGGSGNGSLILAHSGGHGISNFPHAGRVSRRSWCLSRAAARGCVKTPNSPIAFPLEARIARLQCTLAPLPSQSAQALSDRSPPARLFTQSGELLGDLPFAPHITSWLTRACDSARRTTFGLYPSSCGARRLPSLTSDMRLFASRRLALWALVGRVAFRTFGFSTALRTRLTKRSIASSRFRSWLRKRRASITSTPWSVTLFPARSTSR